MNFISKEEKEKIDILNKIMGTKYRSKPYDFNNPEDIIEATVMVTAEFADWAHYWSTLDSLVEAFDESMEVFNPAAWTSLTFEGTTNNKKLDAAHKSLEKTESIFYDLMNKSEEKCAKMWEIVLYSSNDSVLQFFFGSTVRFDKEAIKCVLEEKLFDAFSEIEYDGVVETSAINFAKALKKYLLDPNLK